MKLKFTAFLCSLFFFYAEIYAQCELTATVLPADIVCGDCTQLTAFGQGQGLSVFTEDFNSGAPTGWQSTSQATITSTLCNPHPSGTQYLWMGDAASVPRILTTTAYDFTAAVAGATICFDMVFAEQGNATPCEGPDEPDEGVAIQYSIDGGTTWTDINYFDPNGGNDPSLINWNTWCFAVPAGGLTNNTQFRWFQDNDSGAEYDHWGLDNVDIYFNDATYEIVWQHDGYSYGVGNSGGTNPTPVCPQTTTTYTVTMSNGTTTCTDQVTVNVSPPTFRVTADTAQTICAGECVDLVGEATVIKNPAAVRQFENNDFAVVATGSASVNVNVQGMNAQTITPGLITEICVNSFDFSGSQLCTDFLNGCNCNGTPISFGDMCNLDVSSFTLTVTTPDNCTITLVPAGVATQGYNSVCFVPSGGANINSGTFPTSGTWNPNEPFSVLDGCSTEGVWTLEFDGGSGIGFGLGTLSGWSITFDDPEISYTGNYTWSPTTNMTNSTSLNPTVCPTATSTYTLNVADTAGCTSASDDVTITIDNNCCNFNIGAVVTQPTCGASNGAIDISITNGSGNYTYNWTSGQGSNQDLNNIAAGTYNLTVTDVTQACSKDTVITLNQASGLVIDSVVSYNPTCHDSCNGGIQVYPSSVGLTYTWYDELNNIIGSNSNSISNLCSGNYSVLVESSTSTILNSNYDFEQGPGGSCDCPTGFTCGNDAGQVFDGIHPVYAAGNRGCIASSTNYTNSLGASGGNGYVYFYAGGDNIISTPSYSFIGGETVEICVDYSGPQGSGAPGQNTANAYFSLGVDGVRVGNNVLVPTNTAWTQYCFTITMSAGSHSFDILSGGAAEYSMWFDNFTVTIINSGSTCQQTFEDTLINPTQTDASFNFNDFCYGTINGPTNITTVGGIFTFNPIPSDGASINSTTGEISNEVSGTTYSIEYSLLGTCPASSIETVSVNGSSINAISTTPASCGNADGTITITASGGTAPLQYSIDGSTYQASNVFSNQSAGSYTVYVRDTNLCVDDSTTTISNAGGAIITDVTNTPTSCGNNDGTITITASGGTAPLQYSIDGTTYQASNVFSNQSAGSYTVYVRDANLCVDDSTTTISNTGGAIITDVTNTPATCGNNDGTITITASGGTAPLQYSIDGTTYQASNVFSNQNAGSYTVYVRDANLCVDDSTTTISNTGGAIITDVTNTPATCGNNDGTITITASGGTAPLQYSIDGTTYQASNVFSNQGAGSYTVYVRDANLCVDDSTATISNANGPTISNVATVNTSCGNTNGTITITATGGTAPLTYSIDGGTTTQSSGSFTGLTAGTYNIVVNDANNCPATATANISSSSSPTISNVTTTDATCGNADGSITITASGGTAPLSYSIDGGSTFQTSNIFNTEPSGSYSIVVEDASGCSDNSTAQINNIGGPAISNVATVNTSCGNANGTITITASGGVAPLTYSIDGGTTTQSSGSFTGLTAGTYNIVVNDANNCSTNTTAQIASSTNPSITDITATDENCNSADGSITITAIDGTTPLSYSIDGGANFQSSNVFDNLSQGSYNIVVQDNAGCSTNGTAQINNQSGVDSLLANVSDVLCFGEESGSVQLSAYNGATPYTYFLVNNNTLQNSTGLFSNLPAGDYATWVQDANGCEHTLVVQIAEPTELMLSDSVINPSCFGNDNGQVILTATGGTVNSTSTPYIYTLGSTTNSNGIFLNIAEGNYVASVTDVNGCETSIQVQLNDPDPVFVEINPGDTSITLGQTFTMSANMTSASGTVYQYEWSPAEGLSCTDCAEPFVNTYQSTEYALVFTDENGCQAYADIYVEVLNPNQYFIPNAFTPSGFDNTNNTFKVYGNHIKYIDMMVFNRWGEKIFESSSIDPEWDGTYKGKDQNPGVYNYYIKITFLNDDVVSDKGSITLLR